MAPLLFVSLFLCEVLLANAVLIPPKLTIDLDLPPTERFQKSVQTVLNLHGFDHSFGPVFEYYNSTLFDNISPSNFSLMGDIIKQQLPEHAAELQGISEAFAAAGVSVSYEYLSAWVMFHELDHTTASTGPLKGVVFGCTGIIVQDAAGSIFHGRNMDQSPPQIRNITLQLEFWRKGQLLFTAVDWYWFTTGVETALKQGLVSLEENWRFEHNVLTVDMVLESFATGVASPQVLLYRTILSDENITSFSQVVSAVNSSQQAAPFYAIIAGTAPGEGVVLTRGRGDISLAPLWLPQNVTDEEYFIVQTNYDWFLPDPPSDPRRTAAQNLLRTMTQAEGAHQLGVFATAMSPPVNNGQTAYTAIMSAKEGTTRAFVHEMTMND